MCGYECEEDSEGENEKTEIQRPVNVETAISIDDVGSLPDLADCF